MYIKVLTELIKELINSNVMTFITFSNDSYHYIIIVFFFV